MTKAIIVLGVFVATLGSGSARAQVQVPSDSAPTVRATTSEVLLDVVVRDKRGKPIKNIKAEEVEIYEDGVLQDVLSFRAVGAKESRAPAGEKAQTTRQRSPRSLRAVNLLCVVFHNLDPLHRLRATEAVNEFLKQDLPPESYIGLFVLDDRLKPVHPFSKDRQEIASAINSAFSGRVIDFNEAAQPVLTANPNQVTVAALVTGRSATVTTKVSGGEVARTVITGADVSTGAGANAIRGDKVREREDFANLTGMRALDSMNKLVRELGTLPGRKTVLLTTTGLITTGDPDQLEALVKRANEADITLYALDVVGLNEDSTGQAGNIALNQVASVSRSQSTPSTSAAESRIKSRQGDTLENAIRNSDVQANLRAIAEQTGGFLIANTHDFRKPFAKIIEDLDTHYELSYRPKSDNNDAKLRKIEVRVARKDVSVDSRTGYFSLPDLKGSGPLSPHEIYNLAVLNADPRPHSFDFRTAAFQFRGDPEKGQAALAFEIPGNVLSASAPEGSGNHRIHFSLLSLIKDEKGQVVDKYSVDAPFSVPPANLQAIRSSSVTYAHPVNAPPGKYTVETAVVDRESGRSSATSIPLYVPPPKEGVAISSVVLVQAIQEAGPQTGAIDPLVFQGKRALPLVSTSLAPGTKPFVYFVVYPDKASAEKPKIQVEILVDGQVVGKQVADLPAPDASGVIPMMLQAVLRPGNCEFRVTAIQGERTAANSVTYTVPAQ